MNVGEFDVINRCVHAHIYGEMEDLKTLNSLVLCRLDSPTRRTFVASFALPAPAPSSVLLATQA